MTIAPGQRQALRFGEFTFSPALRRLERQGALVELSSRSLDILAVLTERPGEVIGKQELLARVWPQATVVEAALRVYMVALRRALGDTDAERRIITTVPGRGYCFVGEIEPDPRRAAPGAGPASEGVTQLPSRPGGAVGRDAIVEAVLRQLQDQRFVTLVGPGGIGKTTVALLAAHDWVAARADVAVFVDLGDVGSDSKDGVAEALCARLGLVSQGLTPTATAVAYLKARPMLVVLDTCESVIEAAARLAEVLVSSVPTVRVLATSREALRAQGEVLSRIGPLAAPAADPGLTAAAALEFPAVQLFVQRATANDLSFTLSDEQAPIIGGICRELDGIALAIELAASRVAAFGLQKVADLLATEFALTWPGRRTATPRQQTLRAALNWSHALLAPAERVVFRRLSTLAGAFPLEAAIAACADDVTLSATDIAEAISSLVSKSLLNAVVDGPVSLFRMLDTTRSYALTKLAEDPDERASRLRHAEYYLDRLSAPQGELDTPLVTAEVVANLGAALLWAFSAQGDRATGIRLTGAAAGFWVRHGFLAECRRWAGIVQAPGEAEPTPLEVRTRLILANALMVTDGISAAARREMEATYAKALREGEQEERVYALCAVWADHHRRCQYAAADRLLADMAFLDGPAASHAHRLTALWMKGMTDHSSGRQARACEHLNRLLSDYTEEAGRQFLHQFGYDLEAAAATILGMSEFLRGNLSKAFAANDRALAKARTLNSPISLRAVLRWRATILYYVDEEGLEVDHLKRDIIPTEAFGDADRPEGTSLAVHGLWLARNGDWAKGVAMVRRGLQACVEADYLSIQSFLRAEIALQLQIHGAGDQIDEFLSPLEAESEEEGWQSPEVLRVRGEIAERRGDLDLAATRYVEALAMAERQDAQAWRLRAGLSLAGLWRKQGREPDASALLAPICEQFPPNLDWSTLRRATGGSSEGGLISANVGH